MAESRFVVNGFAAGLAAGVVSILFSLQLVGSPRLPEILRQVGLAGGQLNLVLRILGDPVTFMLIVVPSSVVTLGLLGLLFGWVQEELLKRAGGRGGPVLWGVVSGLMLTAILTLPSLFFNAGSLNLLSKLATGASYTVVLAVLSRGVDWEKRGEARRLRY